MWKQPTQRSMTITKYEEIEVEEYEEIVEESRSESPLRLTISEVETITPQDEKIKKETLILKSDGTTEIFEKEKKKSKVGRALTSQEESILLPLIQGLLAANNPNDQSKHENTPYREKESTTNAKDDKAVAIVNDNEKDETSLTQGANILGELSTALNRLQSTILEGKEVVSNTRKRNTILTLVAWLKRILQAPASEANSNATSNDAQICALTDLLPTELLLSKLMPQLNNGNDVNTTLDENAQSDERSPASSKRFSRQRNNRFNTIGVSKEELADARLYLQKKLLSENLAATDTKTSIEIDQQQKLLDDSVDTRRQSLNLSQTKNFGRNIDNILKCSKGTFSKSVDVAPSDDDSSLQNLVQSSKISESRKVSNARTESEQSMQNHSKVVYRKKSNSSVQSNHRQYASNSNDQDPTTDTDDDQPNHVVRNTSNGSMGSSTKPMNKFALRKMKMKRANTIDIPKNNVEELQSDHGQSDSNKNSHGFGTITSNNIHRQLQAPNSAIIDKSHASDLQVKSPHDKKFHAFLNRNNEENRLSWLNPSKNGTVGGQQVKTNWSNKFGSIKNAFEHTESPHSPQLNRKTKFTHAPTSPFEPVQNNKPPQIPNGSYLYHNSNQQVMRKIAAIQSNEHKEQMPNQLNMKPQLKTHQSLPNHSDETSPFQRRSSESYFKTNDWQQNKYSSVDNYVQNNTLSTAYNPLYVPPNKQSSRSPMSQPSPNKIPVSPASLPGEFPAYTYTCTDYTQPAAVSYFGPEKDTPPIKTKILPDTSYLKNQPAKSLHPTLGSSALSMQMKTIDLHSSSEYLSEPSYFRSPQPFSPTYDFNQMQCYDSQPESQEFTARSQIMQYPSTQTATYINKPKQYDVDYTNQRGYNNNIRNERKYSESYSEKNSSISPFSENNFVQMNQTYMPPQEPISQNKYTKPANNFMSMENISSSKFDRPEPGQPLRLKNNTSYYGSHAALTASQHRVNAPSKRTIENNKAAPLRLNKSGGQYIQPKIENNFDKSGPIFGRTSSKETAPSNVIKNNVTNLNRSQTITHQRIAQAELKRKQSLPAQGSDYFDTVYKPNEPSLPPTHNYLPSGVLKRSKSSHTLALLQQFENKGKTTSEAPLPSYVKKPTISAPMNEVKPKSILVNAQRTVENVPKPIVAQNNVSQQPKPVQSLPFDDYKPKVEPKAEPVNASPIKLEPMKVEPIISQPVKPAPVKQESIRPETPQEIQAHESRTEVSSKSHEGTTVTTTTTTGVVMRKKQQLEPPEVYETPSSPSVEDGHIIFPGQTVETRNRVQHYAQTLNAMLNRKSIVLEDEDEESDKNELVKSGVLQKSKSGTLLAVPKQYESAIKKSEVEEKQRTVAAYFAGNKSPSQSLQRSSSQHSILSSSSFKSAKENSNTTSPSQADEVKESTEIRESRNVKATATTSTTKSSHHLKILRRQQKSCTNSPLAKSQTLPSINLLDESNVDDAFDDLFASFNANVRI